MAYLPESKTRNRSNNTLVLGVIESIDQELKNRDRSIDPNIINTQGKALYELSTIFSKIRTADEKDEILTG